MSSEMLTKAVTDADPDAAETPYIIVLNHLPFVIPFEIRIQLFRMYIAEDLRRLTSASHVRDVFDFDDFFDRRQIVKARIRRDHIFEDGFDQLNAQGPNLKRRVQVIFVSKHGYEEAGVDGGGLFKDFLTDICKIAFDIDLGLFQRTFEQLIYPNPNLYATEPQQLAYFEFLGRLLGKALQEGILIEASFAPFFLNKWLGRPTYRAFAMLIVYNYCFH